MGLLVGVEHEHEQRPVRVTNVYILGDQQYMMSRIYYAGLSVFDVYGWAIMSSSRCGVYFCVGVGVCWTSCLYGGMMTFTTHHVLGVCLARILY